MNRKYQVFISSTYEDLKDERLAVTQCLLDNDCIPVGMEQFPASGMNQMEYITKMLDDCDYYILILAGRYGSLDSDGIGFTEKEFDYAISKKIPVMSFLVTDIGALPSSKCETNDKGRRRLNAFREKVSTGRMVKFHSDIGTLKANVVTAINRCKIDFPALGWVRGTESNTQQELPALKEQVNELEKMVGVLLGEEKTVLLPKDKVKNESTIQKNVVEQVSEEQIELKGLKLALEDLAKCIPKISMGAEAPTKLDEGEIYIQYE